jgi:hypothetical protein
MSDENENNKTPKLNFKIDPLLHEGEGHKPVKEMTRRELLGQGFILGAGTIMAPTFIAALSEKAYGQPVVNCGGAIAAGDKIGFLSLDLSGGASISGNVLIGQQGGQMDALSADGYQFLGWAPGTEDQVNNELGLVFQADSGFLRGIKDKASAAAISRVNGAVVSLRSANDTQNNTQSPIYGISKAGASGAISSLMSTGTSTSGAKSQSPAQLINLEVKPIRVRSNNDLNGTVDTGKLVGELGSTSALKVLNRISKLSESKKAKLTDAQVQKDLLQCGYVKAEQTIATFGSPAALDVFQDTNLVGQANSIFTMNELTSDSKLNRAATYSKAIVNGYGGAGVIEMGGYDYHNGTRSRGETRDFEAGQTMGAAIEYAHRMNKPLIVYVSSDGSVRSNGELDNSIDGRGKGDWIGDAGNNSAAFMLVYNPGGRPQMTAVGNQLGYYIADGVSATAANLVGNSPTNLAYWAILNFMVLNGNVNEFLTEFPENPFGNNAAALTPYINFQPLA